MKKHLFSLLQRIGQSFMLPIALLPIAGIFLGIGSSLTNTNMLAAYHLKAHGARNSSLHPVFTA